jgi:Tfp pilus assembly protein PilX
MKTLRMVARDERGVAVVVGLIALLSLTALVLAFLAISAFEPQIAANLSSATQARYLAEAGVEAGFDGLANTTNWSTALTGATCSQGAVAPTTTQNSALPGMTSSSGTYTVRVRNDCTAGDNTMTGVTVEASATTDGNSRVILVSTGTLGNATKTVTVVVKKAALPAINAALAFPGLNSDIDFSGSSFSISGKDTNIDLTAGTSAPVFGISVGTNSNNNLSNVRTGLANNQQNSVNGRDASDDPSPPNTFTNGVRTTNGDYAAAFDTTLTSAAVTDFVNAVKGNADITVDAPKPSSGNAAAVSLQNIGNSCSSSINDSNCWGTDANPKIVYVKGNTTTDASSEYTAVKLTGNSSGTGILIIENGSFEVEGSFTWKGPIIVQGNNVKLRYSGGGDKNMFGSVIVNELVPNGSTNLEAEISGNAKIFYSTQANNIAMNGIGGRRLMSLYSWQE